MKEPTNYAEWCFLFDAITEGQRNDDYIELIKHGYISWSSGVAERFVKASMEMIKTRINKAHDIYQKQMINSRGINNIISNALKSLNKEYRYVYLIASAFPIPSEHRDQILKIIQDQATQTQKNLEDSAKSDRTGHLTSLIRNSPVNKFN